MKYRNLSFDKIGKQFGRWTIVEFSHKDEKQRALYWKCRCICGTVKVVRYSQLTQGKSKSCGCYQKQIATSIIIEENRKRILPIGIAAMRNLYRSYKKDASSRKFEIGVDDFVKLTSDKCYYCGTKPKQLHVNEKWNGSYLYNGIDRVDNKRGYVIDNLVSCCKWCNYAKNNRSKEEFLFWIKLVYNKQFQ